MWTQGFYKGLYKAKCRRLVLSCYMQFEFIECFRHLYFPKERSSWICLLCLSRIVPDHCCKEHDVSPARLLFSLVWCVSASVPSVSLSVSCCMFFPEEPLSSMKTGVLWFHSYKVVYKAKKKKTTDSGHFKICFCIGDLFISTSGSSNYTFFQSLRPLKGTVYVQLKGKENWHSWHVL